MKQEPWLITPPHERGRSTRDLPENPASRKSPVHCPGLEVLTSTAQDLRHPSSSKWECSRGNSL